MGPESMVSRRNTKTSYKIPKERKECGFGLERGGEDAVECDERCDAEHGTAYVVELLPPE
jgi:hypothetical protein